MSSNNPQFTDKELQLIYDIIRQSEIFVAHEIEDCMQHYGHHRPEAKKMAEKIKTKILNIIPQNKQS